jgi:acetyltransferase
MLGLGGIFAEALKDTAFAVAPLAQSDAHHLIDRLRSQQILNGFRNSPPVDRDALADILIRLGRIGMIFPQIQAIDINPLIVSKGMPIAVDASIEIH